MKTYSLNDKDGIRKRYWCDFWYFGRGYGLRSINFSKKIKRNYLVLRYKTTKKSKILVAVYVTAENASRSQRCSLDATPKT